MEKIFYAAQVIGGLHNLFAVVLGLSTGLAIIITIGALINADSYDTAINEGDDEEPYLISFKVLRKWAVRLWITAAIAVIGSIFTPSKETFLFMIGGQAVDKIVEQNPEVKEIPGNTIDLLNEYIKAQTDNIKAKHKTD